MGPEYFVRTKEVSMLSAGVVAKRWSIHCIEVPDRPRRQNVYRPG